MQVGREFRPPLSGIGYPPPPRQVDVFEEQPSFHGSQEDFHFWDWHSWIILTLLPFTGMYLWKHRSYYLALLLRAASHLRGRLTRFDSRIDIEMGFQEANLTVSSEIHYAETPSVEQNDGNRYENEVPIMVSGDSFLDCREE